MTRSHKNMATVLMAALLAVALIGAFLAGPARAAGIRITFAPEAQVKGPQIRIEDLASSISGGPAEAIERLRETLVGPSPAPGRSKRIDSRRINQLLSFDNLGLDSLQARIPPRITVRRASLKVTRGMMEQAFREAVEDNLTTVPDHLEITDIKTPKGLTLTPGELGLDPRIVGNSRMPGRVTVNLDFLVDGEVVESKRLTGMVKFFQRTVVSSRPLQRGRVIKATDLRVVRRQVRSSESSFFQDSKELIGLVAKRSIMAGQPIRPNQVEQRVVAKRGDRVILVAKKGRLSITAKGVVRDQKGVLGDQVKVLNLTTKREVFGRLVKPGMVVVTF